jgi:TRAP-type C4-dicarboxylate transport system permease small subunit
MPSTPGFVTAIDRISGALDRAIGVLCAILFGAMTVVVLVGIFFRFVLHLPLSWTEEVSRYLMIWGASVAVSMGVRADEHVGLTILSEVLKAKVLRLVLSSIVFLCVLGFLVIMLAYALQMSIESDARISPDLGITMLLPTLAVPVAMGLALIQLLLNFMIKAGGGARNHDPNLLSDR